MEGISNVLVVCVGVGIVFFGLICLVVLCKVMGWLVSLFGNGEVKEKKAAPSARPVPAAAVTGAAPAGAPIANRQEFVAAVSAAIAEQLGADVSAIRITSIQKL